MAEQAPAERAFNWTIRPRDYAAEWKKYTVPLQPAGDSHPLAIALSNAAVLKSSAAADPLQAALMEDPLSALSSPLSRGRTASDAAGPAMSDGGARTAAAAAAAAAGAGSGSAATAVSVGSGAARVDGEFLPWKLRAPSILQKYTTNSAIPVPDFVGEVVPRAAVAPGASSADRVKQRLEELDSSQAREQAVLLQLNQKDYIRHIQALNQELVDAWHKEERVKALKIVIQCAKCLADTSVPQFYPSMFVCVTEILDTFGELVWDRLRRKAVPADPITGLPTKELPVDFTIDDVSEDARETAKNWFFKIASIRELLPRLYVELAILRCSRFIGATELSRVLLRHAAMIRGLGDPLVATYARAYLMRIGVQAEIGGTDFMTTALYDFLFTAQQWESRPVLSFMQRFNLDLAAYLDLYAPAAEFILDVVARFCPQDAFRALLAQFRTFCNKAFVLQFVFQAFPAAVVVQHAMDCAALARDADSLSLSRDKLYMALGMQLVAGPAPQRPIEVLNEIWKVVGKFTDPVQYMNVAQVFIEYPLKHLSFREVGVLLNDILKHVSAEHAYERVQPQLQAVVQRIVARAGALEKALALERFMGLVDLFQKDAKLSVCLSVMEAFSRSSPTRDPVTINSMFHVGRILHDSINSTSLQDERREVTQLLQRFISKVDYGQDFEAQLNFFVECRQAFANLDAIKSYLVQETLSLAMRTLQLVRGNHTKRTLAFAKACLAYCFITIPSMTDVLGRLHLFVLAGAVALHNQLLSQADAFFRAAITLLPDVPVSLEEDSRVRFTADSLSAFIAAFAGMLVVVPGHPETGPLYLVHGLLNVIRGYAWERGSDGRARALLCVLSLLGAMAQESLPYHLPKVDSNDQLYGAEPEFQTELRQLLNAVVDEVMADLQALGEHTDKSVLRRQATLALDLFNMCLSQCTLDTRLATLAYNLYQLARRNGAPESYLRSSLAYAAAGPSTLHKQLATKLQG